MKLQRERDRKFEILFSRKRMKNKKSIALQSIKNEKLNEN